LELLARVRALLRRSQSAAESPSQYKFGDVAVDFKAYSAAKGGRPLEMTRREFQLLRTLVSHPNQVLTRDQLLDMVVGEDVYITNRVIDNHIAALRSKLENDPAEPEHLLTVRGVGYKWIA